MVQRDFQYNPTTQLYDITEGYITYSMPLEFTLMLRISKQPQVYKWYNTEVSQEDKKFIIVSGHLEDTVRIATS